MSCIFKVGGKKTVLRISPSTKLCGAQTNKAKQVQIKQSTLAPFIQLGLLQLVWPHVFDALWWDQRCGSGRIPSGGQTEGRYSAPELLKQVGRCAGMQERPVLFPVLGSHRELFSCNAVIFTPSKTSTGAKAQLLFKQALWKWEIKLHHADHWKLQRASAPKRCDLALQVLESHFVLRPLGLQIGSLSASRPLKGAFKSLPAGTHSLNDLFIC